MAVKVNKVTVTQVDIQDSVVNKVTQVHMEETKHKPKYKLRQTIRRNLSQDFGV